MKVQELKENVEYRNKWEVSFVRSGKNMDVKYHMTEDIYIKENIPTKEVMKKFGWELNKISLTELNNYYELKEWKK